MDIKPPAGSATGTTSSNTNATSELPASLQQLPRDKLLTAVVQSSSPAQPQTPASAPQTLAQIISNSPQRSQTTAGNPQSATSSTDQSQSRAFNVLLNISGQQIQTQSNTAFNVGQLLKVEITANAGLRVVEVASKNPPLDQALIQLQQGLRQALPLQQSPKLLLNNLVPLFQLLQQLPASPATAQIRHLLATIPELKQLTNPATLKNSVNQSGLFMEAKIKQLQGQIQQLLQNSQPQGPQNKSAQAVTGNPQLTPAAPQNKQPQINRQSQPGFNQQTLQSDKPVINAQPQQTSSANSAAAREQIHHLLKQNPQLGRQLEQMIGQDFKTQLLKLSSTLLPLLSHSDNSAASNRPAETALLQRILQALPDTRGNSLSGTPVASSTTSGTLTLPNLPINTQLQHLLTPNLATTQSNPQQAGPNQSSTLDLAVSTVLRQIAASLAQVQASQLQSLVAPRADGDGGQLLNSWSVEIPVLLEGQFKPVQLHINEERHPDSSLPGSEQRRVWKITLGFDFEELDEFFATLRIIDTSVSATFWSDKPETLQRISSELQHLNKSLSKLGLDVEELECRCGKPQIKETRLDQQLVDIKT